MFTVSYAIKQVFFDRAAVIDATSRAEKTTLSKAGSFIRRRSRSSLRRRKKVSAPGTPPSVHSTDSIATLKNILFGWEQNNRSVVVGMVKLGGRQSVPQLHEFGGTSIRKVNTRSGPKIKAMKYPERPTMGPALKAEVESGRIAGVWAGAIRS